jgi:hypothetical protein
MRKEQGYGTLALSTTNFPGSGKRTAATPRRRQLLTYARIYNRYPVAGLGARVDDSDKA